MIYQLKISLTGTHPPAWIRIQLDGKTTFATVHELIQIAFGWDDAHLHGFDLPGKSFFGRTSYSLSGMIQIGPKELGLNDPFEAEILDERKCKLEDYLKDPGDRGKYTYDYGDDWVHDLLLEAISDPEDGALYPRCVKVSKGFHDFQAIDSSDEEDGLDDIWEDDAETEPDEPIEEPSTPKERAAEINCAFKDYRS